MIECGWCGNRTANRDRCTSCGHEDPARPWEQRGQTAPEVSRAAGRPKVDAREAQRRISAAGVGATDDEVAVYHDVDPRTVRHWRAKVSG